MRARGVVAVVAVVIAMAVSGCASAPPPSAGDLFREYTRSTDVKNDKFPSGDATSEDRVANFAAYYSPEGLQSALLAASPCDQDDDCQPGVPVLRAAEEFVGRPAPELFERSILVKRQDESLELLPLYVVRGSGSAAVIDSNGQVYRGGLDDFRANNGLLSSSDMVLAPRDLAAVPGKGEIVAATGHTPMNWQPWLFGAVAAVVAVGGGFALLRRGRSDLG